MLGTEGILARQEESETPDQEAEQNEFKRKSETSETDLEEQGKQDSALYVTILTICCRFQEEKNENHIRRCLEPARRATE